MEKKQQVHIKWFMKAKYLLTASLQFTTLQSLICVWRLSSHIPWASRKPKINSIQLITGLAQNTANGTVEAIKSLDDLTEVDPAPVQDSCVSSSCLEISGEWAVKWSHKHLGHQFSLLSLRQNFKFSNAGSSWGSAKLAQWCKYRLWVLSTAVYQNMPAWVGLKETRLAAFVLFPDLWI